MNTPHSPSILVSPEVSANAKKWRPSLEGFPACLAFGAGLTLLYALSMGPALRMNQQGKISPETLERVYLPLSILLDSLGAQSMFETYLMWWVSPSAPASETGR